MMENVNIYNRIYELSTQFVHYFNGAESMYAAVLPLAMAMQIIKIVPTNNSWEQVGYIRIKYSYKSDKDILDFKNRPLRDLVDSIAESKDICEIRLSFFVPCIESKTQFRRESKKITDIADIPAFLRKYPPNTVKSKQQKTDYMKIITIAYSPERKGQQIQIVYSGFNDNGDIYDLFEKVHRGYESYAQVLSLDW